MGKINEEREAIKGKILWRKESLKSMANAHGTKI